ncbi:MAG: glyoxylate reductase [Candidatus Thorarchaeota archaeon]
MANRVFVTRKIPEEGLDLISKMYEVDVWTNEIPPTTDEIASRASDCVGVISLLSDRIDTDLLARLPNLKVIAQYAVGYDNINVKEATQRGIVVTNTPGVLTETTADLTWALIMAASRRLVEADKFVREKKWDVAWGPQFLLGSDVYGATLGIIGLGRIGEAVARRALGFNMRILYFSRKRNEGLESELGAMYVDLQTLLRESNIVTLHVPLTTETTHLIGEEEFKLMKEDSVLVNTSRGNVVDEDALYDALSTGKIGSAGLDVFREEPIPKDSPLLRLDNVVILPHIGSASIRTRVTMSRMCAENLIAALEGERPPNIINPGVL